MMESALSQGQIDVVKFDMLPQYAVNAGYKSLSRFPGSTSLSIDRDNDPSELGEDPSYTVSSERNQRTAEYGFTWNALDFGLSYVRAGQQADRYLISKELEIPTIGIGAGNGTDGQILLGYDLLGVFTDFKLNLSKLKLNIS